MTAMTVIDLHDSPEGASAAEGARHLAHLLWQLRKAADLMDEVGMDVDSQVIRAHAAQLERGREWPGDPIAPTVFSDGSTI
jgi:hypothetical protein